jgi:hypothetical protein
LRERFFRLVTLAEIILSTKGSDFPGPFLVRDKGAISTTAQHLQNIAHVTMVAD